MNASRAVLAALLLSAAAPAFAQTVFSSTAAPPAMPPGVSTQAPVSLEGLPIVRVDLHGNRTQGAILSSRITLKVGQPFHESDALQTRRNLYAMRLFRAVEITEKRDENGNVVVDILAKDGWYVVPIPFLFGGSGGSGAGLSLSERNYFGYAESLSAAANVNSVGSGEHLSGSYDRWSANAGYVERSYTQYGYSNGSYNTENLLESSRNLNNPSQYGVIISSANRSDYTASAGAQYVLAPSWRAGLAYTQSHIDYTQVNGPVPNDAGDQDWVTARLNYNAIVWGGRTAAAGYNVAPNSGGWTGAGGGMAELFGSIFGMGLADIGERIRPLPEPRLRVGAGLSTDLGSSMFGSDFDFQRLTESANAQLELPARHTISLRVVASQGFSLPFSQEIATGGGLGLRGEYIRQFIGDDGAGASLSGTYLVHQSHRGVFAVDAFVESATVTGGGPGGTQTGVGGGLSYTFWRFPLPLGLEYTYSLVDHDGEVSFAAGARFGG